MSTTNPNRIQRGVHAGGQFTTGERSEAQVTLSQAPADIEPWELAEGIIEGQQWDVDKVADRDRWATKQWEQYYDAYHEADAYHEVGPYHEASLDTAHSAPTEFEGAATAAFTSEHDGALVVQIDTDEVASGRTVRVIVNDGALFDGDPEQHQVAGIQHHNPGPGASPDHWQFAPGHGDGHLPARPATDGEASVEALVSGALDSYPGDREMSLEHSDQGDYYVADELWGDDRETIADSEDLVSDEHDLNVFLSDLSSDTRYPFIPNGRVPRMDLQAAMAWATTDEAPS